MYIFAVGAFTSIETGSGDIIAGMTRMGMGAFAFVVLTLSQWTTNDNNLYYASTSMEAILPRVNRAYIVLGFGLLATVCGAAGIATLFVDFLVWLGILIPPIGGIVLAHHWADLRHGVSTTAQAKLPLPAAASFIAGTLAGKFLPYGVPALNSIVAAAGIYLVLRAIVPGQYRSDSSSQLN